MRANEDLRLRVARLDLAVPLEALVYRALRAQTADHRHERLTIAGEATCRVMGCALWAAFDATDAVGTIEGAGSVIGLSPDGARLAAGGTDGVARVFPTRLRDVVVLACTIIRGTDRAEKFSPICK